MPHYRRVGEVPAKRHVQFRRDGALVAEELMGVEGFAGECSLLYHLSPPTAITAAEVWHLPHAELAANHPLLPRHFLTHKLGGGGDLVQGRQLLLANDDVRLSYVRADRTSPLYRNAVGDELVFVEDGHGVLESVFGALPVTPGDYVVIPASTTHRWVPERGGLRALVLEAAGHVRIPSRYRSESGQLREGAPYCERDFRAPSEPLVVADGASDAATEVYVRHRDGLGTVYTYAHHPFDVIGWDGGLYPYAFNIEDFEPLVGRIHQPPPVHQTFEGPGFVVCSFRPRPCEFDPLAVPAPYNHANTDSDEVLFYVNGDFLSRRNSGIEAGSVSLHPAGFVHGPQPGSVEASLGQPGTNETAVMLDTFRPLSIGGGASEVEDPAYAWTWNPHQ